MRIAISLLLAVPVFAQALPDFAPVEQCAREELTKLNIPGASIAIVRGDQVVYAKGVGIANVETGGPVKPEMLFRLGSTTKMFTAAALVGLAVQGKIDLNAPVGKTISGLPPRLSQITANQLLSHTAGIHDEAPAYGLHDDSALGNGIHSWTDATLFTEPGKIFSYSNPGYWMAGYLVEVLSHHAYADAMESLVFKPLGMERTTFRPTMAMTWPLAQGHEAEGRGQFKIIRPAADSEAGWPAGSMFSNTAELARFVIAFMNDGRVDGKQVLDPKVIALLSSPHAPLPEGTRSYGYGLMIGTERGVHVLEHGGSRAGYGSSIRMLPDQRVAIIVQANRSGANLPGTVEKAMELMVKLGPKEVAKTRPTLPVTKEDLDRDAGAYVNGEQKIEIVARDNRLFLRRSGGLERPLVKHAADRWAPESGGPDFILVGSADGKAEYLHSGSRSFARVVGNSN